MLRDCEAWKLTIAFIFELDVGALLKETGQPSSIIFSEPKWQWSWRYLPSIELLYLYLG